MLVQQSMPATAVSVTAAEWRRGEWDGWLRWVGAQQGLGQDGRPGPTAASPHANAGHASNPGVAANIITLKYKQASF